MGLYAQYRIRNDVHYEIEKCSENGRYQIIESGRSTVQIERNYRKTKLSDDYWYAISFMYAHYE